MNEKIKEFLKKYLIGFILGVITTFSISVIAATYFPSKDVTYDNKESGLESQNVQGAIDELYAECTYVPKGGEAILDNTDIVTSGDGLYKDEYENRYFYKGTNPNNYITFNDENWRILSIESDGSLKIMRRNSIGNRVWDSSGSYGNNNWARPASLNTYLNGTYLNSLTSTAQGQIVAKDFGIGGITYRNNDLANQINDENGTIWNGKIALPTLSEYLRTNSNSNCKTFSSYLSNYNTCKNTNWMYMNDIYWTLSPLIGHSSYVFYVSLDGSVATNDANETRFEIPAIFPTLYLSSEVQITGGTGTESDPYILS